MGSHRIVKDCHTTFRRTWEVGEAYWSIACNTQYINLQIKFRHWISRIWLVFIYKNGSKGLSIEWNDSSRRSNKPKARDSDGAFTIFSSNCSSPLWCKNGCHQNWQRLGTKPQMCTSSIFVSMELHNILACNFLRHVMHDHPCWIWWQFCRTDNGLEVLF